MTIEDETSGLKDFRVKVAEGMRRSRNLHTTIYVTALCLLGLVAGVALVAALAGYLEVSTWGGSGLACITLNAFILANGATARRVSFAYSFDERSLNKAEARGE